LTPDQIALSTVLERWRGHWSIENQLHWSRDVIMNEDDSRVRSGHAPQTFAALRMEMSSPASNYVCDELFEGAG